MQLVVGIDPYEVRVKSGMVKLGQRDAIRNYGLPKRLITVGNNVGGVKQQSLR